MPFKEKIMTWTPSPRVPFRYKLGKLCRVSLGVITPIVLAVQTCHHVPEARDACNHPEGLARDAHIAGSAIKRMLLDYAWLGTRAIDGMEAMNNKTSGLI